MSNTGVISMGVRCPIIRQGDNLVDIVTENVKKTLEENHMSLEDKDVIGITESVVARAQGNYVTVDDIVEFLRRHNFSKRLELYLPIMSRNRFSIILKAFARYADRINIEIDGDLDEQGNPTFKVNQFTGVNILDYYKEICKSENCEMTVNEPNVCEYTYIDCRCHPAASSHISGYPKTLASIMNEPIMREDGSFSGYNEDWGLLGSNKSNEETLKLFPRKEEAQILVDSIQKRLCNETGKWVEVLIYGDGCFKDPIGGIWEFADPVTCPAYTKGLEGTPNEIKIKAFADGKYDYLSGSDLQTAIKREIKDKDSNLVGKMASQGTTPRRYVDLLASLFDLTSGSGDKGTPVILCKNYFKNYAID